MDRGNSKPGRTQRIVLPNGLVVVHEHIPAAPAVAYHLWVGAGSAHEEPSEEGAAHFLEHMLFKGTDRRDSVAINDEVEHLGGNVNAFTSFDHTAYHLVLAGRFWKNGLDILLDMVFHSRMDEEEMEIERQVILEEIREGDDSPDMYLSERFFEDLYKGHPYGRPVIGTAAGIRKVSRATLRNFYGKWYRPGNVVLSVAGSVEWHALVDAVRDLAGDLAGAENRPAAMPEFRGKEGPVVSLFHRGNEERILEAAFTIPGALHEDIPALELLSVILGGGEMSRLYREIRIKKQLARSVDSNLFVPSGSGKFLIHTLPYRGKELALLEELAAQVALLQTEEVSSLELNRAKLTLDKELIFGDETVEGRAKTLGYFQLTYGTYEEEARYRERIFAATEKQLREVAQRYLDVRKIGVGLMLPKNETDITPERVERTVVESARTRAVKKNGAPEGIHRWSLSNGVRVVFRRVPGAPVSSIYGAVKGGLISETKEGNGVSNLTAMTLDRGTAYRTDEQVAQEVTMLQAEAAGVAGRNYEAFHLDVVTRNFSESIDLFGEILVEPEFEEEIVDQEKTAVLRELETQRDYFESQAMNLFLETLYPGHPYGLNILGTPASIAAMTSEKLRAHHRALFQPESVAVGVVGDIDPNSLKDKLEASLGGYRNAHASPPEIPPLAPLAGVKEVRRPIHGEKAYLYYGFRGTKLNDRSRYSLDVLSALLSSSGGGRLYVRLREELGLVYSVESSVTHGLENGYILIGLNTTPDRAEQALEEVQRELKAVTASAVSEEELARVKNFLIGSYEIDLQRSNAQAAQICLGELYGTDRTLNDYVAGLSAVSVESVKAAAEKYFLPDRSVVVLLSPLVN